jgi:hypothetical protein
MGPYKWVHIVADASRLIGLSTENLLTAAEIAALERGPPTSCMEEQH